MTQSQRQSLAFWPSIGATLIKRAHLVQMRVHPQAPCLTPLHHLGGVCGNHFEPSAPSLRWNVLFCIFCGQTFLHFDKLSMGRSFIQDPLEGPWPTHNLWEMWDNIARKGRILANNNNNKRAYCSKSECSDSDRRWVLWFQEEHPNDAVIESGMCVCVRCCGFL